MSKTMRNATLLERALYRLLPIIVRAEGNKWDGQINGMKARLRRHRRGGHWCGFVQVPDYHRFWGKDLGECTRTPQCIPRQLSPEIAKLMNTNGKLWDCQHMLCNMGKTSVHGGIVFSGRLKGADGWWLGIDFGHRDDLSPNSLKLLGTKVGGLPPYRTRAFATTELRKLAEYVRTQGANA